MAGILGAYVGVRQLDGFIGAVACFSELSCLIGEDDVAGAYAAFCGALLVVAVVSIAAAIPLTDMLRGGLRGIISAIREHCPLSRLTSYMSPDDYLSRMSQHDYL